MNNKVVFNLDGAKKGMDIAYKSVAATLGSSGKNTGYDDFNSPVITNDGISILNRINLEDNEEQFGVNLLKQASQKTDDEANDGTTTAVVLSHAMIEGGLKATKKRWFRKGYDSMKLRKEINEAVDKVISEINATPVTNDEELFNIANISVENPEIAQIIVDAVKKVGVLGEVLVEESNGVSIEKEEIEGFSFDKGYISPYLVTDPEKMECVLENSLVLVTDKTLNLNKDAVGLLDAVMKQGYKQLFIVAENVQGELLSTLIVNRMKGSFYPVIVQRPFNKDMLEDIAALTGATVLTSEKGISELNKEHFSMLGVAKKIIVTKDRTTIIGGLDENSRVDERVTSIQNELKTAEGYEKSKLKERLAKLTGGIVIIKVGAPVEADMKYLKKKIDDSVGATRAAMEEGVVVGGGKTLYERSLVKPSTMGEKIVRDACAMPIKTIIKNSGYDEKVILPQIVGDKIFNSSTGEVEVNNKIIDPKKVERCALKNAASLAGIFITMNSVIIDTPRKANMV
mgnify:CR=1 FL=1